MQRNKKKINKSFFPKKNLEKKNLLFKAGFFIQGGRGVDEHTKDLFTDQKDRSVCEI